MPSITLKRAQVVELIKFCAEHKKETFFVAKDQGAYVGVTAGKDDTFKSIIHYFPKCDPAKDEDWYENAPAIVFWAAVAVIALDLLGTPI